MTSRRRILIITLLLVGAVVSARTMIALRPSPPRLPPEPEAPLVTVDTVDRMFGPIQVFGSGTVRPRSEIGLAPEIGGKIVAVSPNLQSGGHVSAGEVLARIDPADYENRVQQAEADVATQRVGLLQAEEEAKIAASEYEQFRARENSRGGDTADPSPLTLRLPQLAAAQAALARAEAQLRDAQLALSRTEIRSPFDGLVRDEGTNVGGYVAPGQSLARIYAADAFEVVVPISDDDAVLIPDLWSLRAGDGNQSISATVSVTYGTRRFSWPGYVDRAETALDEQSRTIDLVIRVPNPLHPGRATSGDPETGTAPPLLVGQFAQVAIEGIELETYFVVPSRAVRSGNEMWVVEDDLRLRIVPIEVLQAAEGKMFIRGALRDGLPVVVGGINLATEGMLVRMNPAGGR